jgi:hypothetical protein
MDPHASIPPPHRTFILRVWHRSPENIYLVEIQNVLTGVRVHLAGFDAIPAYLDRELFQKGKREDVTSPPDEHPAR